METQKTDSSLSLDMTEGPLAKKILFFSLPLVFTNVLQIFFNMADTAIAGRFAGYLALGSVGSTGQMIFFCSGMLAGLGGGVNVLAAICTGQKNFKELEVTVRASFVSCLAAGLVLLTAGFVFCPPLLRMMNTKPELFDDAVLYFRIYMLSMPAMALYFFGNALLSARGDTKSPLLFLILAGIINVVLDIVLVVFLHLDVAGVGIATVAAQYVSCFLTLYKIYTVLKADGFDFKMRGVSLYKVRQVLKIGLPSGLQNSIFAAANIFIAAAINTFDAVMVAGNAASMNGDNLIYNIMAAFYSACAVFIGQNLGAQKKKRILNSYLISLLYSAAAGFVLGTLLFIFGRQFLALFSGEPAVIECAMLKFKIMTFSFGISAFMDCTIAASRGLRKTLVPSFIVFTLSCVFRVLWVFTVFAHFRTVESLFLLYPFSWALTALFEIIYFVFIYKSETEEMGETL